MFPQGYGGDFLVAEQPLNGDMKQRLRDLEQENGDILKAYQELQKAEEFYRVTLENIADTIVITDDRGGFVYVCPNTTDIFGLSREEVYERSTIRELLGGSPSNCAAPFRISQPARRPNRPFNNQSGISENCSTPSLI